MSFKQLPKDINNIIDNYVKQIETSIKYSKVLKKINKIKYFCSNDNISKIHFNNNKLLYANIGNNKILSVKNNQKCRNNKWITETITRDGVFKYKNKSFLKTYF